MVKIKIILYGYRYSFITHVKKEDIYKDIAEDVETRFDTSNYEIDRRFSMGKNKKSGWINET